MSSAPFSQAARVACVLNCDLIPVSPPLSHSPSATFSLPSFLLAVARASLPWPQLPRHESEVAASPCLLLTLPILRTPLQPIPLSLTVPLSPPRVLFPPAECTKSSRLSQLGPSSIALPTSHPFNPPQPHPPPVLSHFLPVPKAIGQPQSPCRHSRLAFKGPLPPPPSSLLVPFSAPPSSSSSAWGSPPAPTGTWQCRPAGAADWCFRGPLPPLPSSLLVPFSPPHPPLQAVPRALRLPQLGHGSVTPPLSPTPCLCSSLAF
ncbi:unnamed protein product [Closterium sp. NIES-64]|nr:unnamed protein product [Closterium sp. NIES-64]